MLSISLYSLEYSDTSVIFTLIRSAIDLFHFIFMQQARGVAVRLACAASRATVFEASERRDFGNGKKVRRSNWLVGTWVESKGREEGNLNKGLILCVCAHFPQTNFFFLARGRRRRCVVR